MSKHFTSEKMGDFCEFVRGPFGGALKKEIFVNEGYAVYEQNHAIYNQYTNIRYFITETKYREMKRFEINFGDIIMSCSGTMGKVSIVPKDITKGIINQALLKITPNKKVNVLYLKYWMESTIFQNLLKSYTQGAAIKNVVSVKILKQLRIPLPPLETQKRIVELLDRAQALIDKRKEQIALMDQLIQSLFYDMFGDPVANPKEWEISKFGDCIDSIIGGKSIKGELRKMNDGEYAVLKVSAVTSGIFNPNEYKVVDLIDLPEELIHPQKDDLLFSRANTKELVGATCIVDSDYNNLLLPDKLWKIKLLADCLNNRFVKILLSHAGFRENLKRVATGTSGSMLNISKAKLRNLNILIPPIDLQNKFADRVQKIEARKSEMTASLRELEDNFNALMQGAFKGDI